MGGWTENTRLILLIFLILKINTSYWFNFSYTSYILIKPVLFIYLQTIPIIGQETRFFF